MRISDWRSDVCSSDLQRGDLGGQLAKGLGAVVGATHQAELVLHERVADFDDFHAAKSSAWVGATPPTAAKSKTVGGVAPTYGRLVRTPSASPAERKSVVEERVCTSVLISVVAVSVQKQNERDTA